VSKSDSYYAEQYDLRQVIVGKCYAIQAGVRIAARDPRFNLAGLYEDLAWCEDTFHYFTVMADGPTLRTYREEVKAHLDRARAALTDPDDADADADADKSTTTSKDT
jgi:hypothetical protein